MPNEKNSALLAMSPARNAARGKFDHRADVIGHLDARLLGDRLGHGVDDRLDRIELGPAETSGTMISAVTGAPVFRPASTAPSKIARACISAISG